MSTAGKGCELNILEEIERLVMPYIFQLLWSHSTQDTSEESERIQPST